MNQETLRHVAFCELIGDVPRTAGESRLRVTGASMLPAVWPGDVITVQHRGWSDLRPGQIVLYRRDGRLIAHRIQSFSGGRMITKGDSQVAVDPPVEESEIIGQVVRISRGSQNLPTEQALWQRIGSSILSRSDFLMRGVLSIHRRLHRTSGVQASNANSTPAGK
jgi:signal peptidase I